MVYKIIERIRIRNHNADPDPRKKPGSGFVSESSNYSMVAMFHCICMTNNLGVAPFPRNYVMLIKLSETLSNTYQRYRGKKGIYLKHNGTYIK